MGGTQVSFALPSIWTFQPLVYSQEIHRSAKNPAAPDFQAVDKPL